MISEHAEDLQWRSCSVSGHIRDLLNLIFLPFSQLFERQKDFYRMNEMGHHKREGLRCDVIVSLFDDMQLLFCK